MKNVYRIKTQAIISNNNGDADLSELMNYLLESDDILKENHIGNMRIVQLKELVGQLIRNQKIENK